MTSWRTLHIFLTSLRTFWRHHDILLYFMTYFPNIVMSWHTFWCYVMIYVLMSWCTIAMYFTFWRHDVLFSVMKYDVLFDAITHSGRWFDTFYHHGELFNIMMSILLFGVMRCVFLLYFRQILILFDVITHFPLRHYVLFVVMMYYPYLVTLWCTSWCYDIMMCVLYIFMLWHAFWRHDVPFDLMTYFFTSWHVSWRDNVILFSILLDFMSTYCRFDVLFDICFDFETFEIIMYFFDVIEYFQTHDISLYVMTYVLTSWHTFWCYDVLFDNILYTLRYTSYVTT